MTDTAALMKEKNDLIQKMLAMQSQFVDFEHKHGIPGKDYYYSQEGLLKDYRQQYRDMAMRVVEIAHQIVGSTRFHDIVAAIDRVEIGYTWYARRCQKTHVNTACKWLLLGHAFEALGCRVVGLRTDNFNFTSQAAIEALGAKKDGVIRHHAARRDGSVRDSVLYSILATEWPDVRRHLELRLARHARRS